MPRDLSFRISTFLIAAVLYTGSPAAGQTARADRFVLNTGPCVQRSDSGSPEGVVTGNACDSYIRTETGQVYFKVSGTGSTGWYPVLGATGATCTTFAGCAAGTLRIDALSFAQRFRTDPNYQLEQHVTLDGGAIQAFNASGWMPLKIRLAMSPLRSCSPKARVLCLPFPIAPRGFREPLSSGQL